MDTTNSIAHYCCHYIFGGSHQPSRLLACSSPTSPARTQDTTTSSRSRSSIPPRAGRRRRKQRGRGRDLSLHIASPTSYCNGRIVYPISFSKPVATASPSNASL